MADAFGIPRVVTDPEAIYADDDIDAICIGTWPYRHREFTVRGLEAGKHVLCEARMATNAAEARDMLTASEAHPDLVAQLVPAPMDFATWRTVRRLLADGTLGELREAHVALARRRWPQPHKAHRLARAERVLRPQRDGVRHRC